MLGKHRRQRHAQIDELPVGTELCARDDGCHACLRQLPEHGDDVHRLEQLRSVRRRHQQFLLERDDGRGRNGLQQARRELDVHVWHDLFGSEVQCWGSNFSGALGDGTTKDSNVPIWAGVPLGFAEAIGTGFDHACAISKNGGVQCWGGNAYGQLGDGVSAAPGPWVPWPVAAGWLLP